MSRTPKRTSDDPQQIIADLRRKLTEAEAERDEALERLVQGAAERSEALKRETATAEVLEVINVSPTDLAPVFDAILEKAMRLCEASFGHVITYDGEHIATAAHRGLSSAYDEFLRAGPRRPGPHGVTANFLGGARFVHRDAVSSEAYRAGNANARAMVDLEGGRTNLAVPLRKKEALLGYIVIYRRDVRPFSDEQIALLQNFAAQAVIAMENARLITETREALEQQTATAEVLGVINSSPGDLAPVFDAMLEKATVLCDAGFGIMLTWDGECFHRVAFRGVPAELIDALRQPTKPLPGTMAEQIVNGATIISAADIRESSAYRIPGAPLRPFVDSGGARSYVAVALRSNDTLLGVFSIYRREIRPFTDKQIALLQNFAAQAVIAMENARLLTETREALEQQTATAEVLQVINSSPGDLTPVFDAMLERAVRLCEFDLSALWIFDGREFHGVAKHGMSDRFWSFIKDRTPPSFARLAAGERLVNIPDLRQIPQYMESDLARQVRNLGLEAEVPRSQLLLALRKDDVLLGAIVAYRLEVRPFSDKQIALLENFAAQAVIAMENARLLTETREALEQQTATAEVLGVINSSPGDLKPVFDALLDKALRLCEASYGTLLTWDGERLHRSAFRGASVELMEALGGEEPVMPPPGSVADRLLRGENIIHTADITQDPNFADSPRVQILGRVGGVRTYIAVPLRKDARLLGFIAVYRREVRPFSDKQIALLQNFAAQAVIAMENARLITETREALEQQTATAEVLGVINSSPGELTPVFEAIVEKAMTLCEAAHGHLWIYDGRRVHPMAVRGDARLVEWMNQHGVSPVIPVSGPGAIGRILAGERFAHITDVLADEAYRSLPHFREMVDHGGIRTLLDVPLRNDGSVLGIIAVYRQEVRSFSDKQIALLENFAAQAVIAMENARLLGELRQRTGDLEEALEQQTATAEVLGVINASPGDLTPVFDAMLGRATHLCGAVGGTFWSYNGHGFQVLAATIGDIGRTMQHPNPGTSLWRIANGENVVQIADIEVEQAYQADTVDHARTRLAGTRTALAVALRKDETLIGAITAGRQEVRPFTNKQIALLQNFAAQAVIAMENARLINETREALEQQTATAEVLGVINSSPGDLAPVFDAILEKAQSLCGVEYGVLLTYDGELFWPVAARGAPPSLDVRNGFRPRGSGFRGLLRGERLLHIHNMAEFAAQRPEEPVYRDLLESGGILTQLAVPLRKDGRLLGIIAVNRQEVKPFSDKQIALLENFAAQAVIAIENARLLGELRQRTDEVAELNRGLEARVAEQVDELGRVGRLKRFLAPQLAELIVSQGDEKILESHRQEIVVVFCDLRGYTAFTETAEPEEVLAFLREYHGALGPLVAEFEGTLDQFSGDGIMVFFNDPVPCPDPAERAVKMAMAMREAAGKLIADWRERGRDLGFGAGIAQGFATLGQIGFSDRSGYTAIGTVCNVAARLCAEAKDNQIFLSQRVNAALKGSVVTEQVGALTLKGLSQPVVTYNVPLAAPQPALRVIEGGPQSV